MATEVLRPQDCLIERIRVPPSVSISRRKSAGYFNGNPSSSCNYYYSYCNRNGNGSFSYASPNPNTNPRSSRRTSEQRKAAASRRSASSEDLGAAEKVTILRRGESLDSKVKSEASGRIGAPASDVYAGSAFAVSPAPSALPLPSFSKKQQPPPPASAVDDSATRDLRRLLRIG